MCHWQVLLSCHSTLQLNNPLVFVVVVFLKILSFINTQYTVTENVKGTYPFSVGTDF